MSVSVLLFGVGPAGILTARVGRYRGISVPPSRVSEMGTLGLTPGEPPFRMTTWNAHTVYIKSPEIEALLHTQRLDVLCVTESWLSPEDIWEVWLCPLRRARWRSCVFMPPLPGPVIDGDELFSYLDGVIPYNMIFFSGDFDAHHISWGCSRSTPRGLALYETSLSNDLVLFNDSLPTYVSGFGVSSSNIDMIFCPLSLSPPPER